MPLQNWNNYVASGQNTLYSGAIIPGGTVQTAGGSNGAVYRGTVRQNWNGWN